ncbi:MAG TPA: hypothetical protein VG944_15545 [Fimbriimonas sp.]|nr:hypothetical protein [Fimbriimonas sp.]
MLFCKPLASLVLAYVAGISSAGSDAASLKFSPKEGVSTSYSIDASLTINASPATMTSKMVEKIVKVDQDGTYSVQTDTDPGKIVYDGNSIDAPKSSSITVYKPNGEIVSMTGDYSDASSLRSLDLTILLRPDMPVNIGDKWEENLKTDPKTGAVAVHGTYTLDGEEKIGTHDAWRVVGSLREVEGTDPGSNEFTYWVSKEDGSVLKCSSKYSNVVFPGGQGPLSGTITYTRVDG